MAAARQVTGMQTSRLLLAAAGLLLALAALCLLPGADAQSPTCGGVTDLGGYTCIDSTAPGGPVPNLVNIGANGTQATPAFSDDSETTPIPLGFTFPWYDITTTQVKASSNGYLCLDASGGNYCGSITFGVQPPGNTNAPNYLLPAYNRDLHCNSNPACTAYTTWGPAGSRVFVFMVNAEGCYPYPSGCSLTWEYKLFQATGCAEVHYGTMTDPNASTVFAGTEGRSPGGTYTGLTYWYSGGPGALSNRAVRYCQTSTPPPACMPATQNIATGGTASWSASGGTAPFGWSSPGGTPASGSGPSYSSTYATQGTYTVTVTDSVGASSQCTVTVTSPGCGYTVNANAVYNFTDLTGIGTGLAHFDDSQIDVPLPFTFQFCGTGYTNARTSS
ncbi:MAG: hypothetical protein ABR562_00265, partial [Thermoplasmatota archaeon]